MSKSRIAAILQQTMGLDHQSIGSSIIESAIRKRMQENQIDDNSSYLELVLSSEAEMNALMEESVVPETWFFRHEEAFHLMIKHLQRKPINKVMRLLSMPCSTGEEAYSMAMAMLDAGFSTDEFHIDAIDISERHLNKARNAEYGRASFRGENKAFRQRHFSKTNRGYALHRRVRQCVNFHCANVLDHNQIGKFGTYDIICCRNLLIYFNQQDRDKTVRILANMLDQDGLLFVGHAETGLMWKQLFSSVPHPMAFAYRHIQANNLSSRTHVSTSTIKTTPVKANRPVRIKAQAPRPIRPTAAITSSIDKEKKTTDKASDTQTPSLDDISRLADQGHTQQAEALCEAYLHEHRSSAQAWFLLGLIHDTQGKTEQAIIEFRKAIYLDSEHYEALLHLALLLEQQGDSRAAQQLQRRIHRITAKPEAS